MFKTSRQPSKKQLVDFKGKFNSQIMNAVTENRNLC